MLNHYLRRPTYLNLPSNDDPTNSVSAYTSFVHVCCDECNVLPTGEGNVGQTKTTFDLSRNHCLPNWKFDTVADVPKSYFQQQKTVFGKVIRVIDGDTMRIAHCRSRFLCPKIDEQQKKIYDKTLSIRIYGVDAPELKKRKSDPPSQPFAEESKQVTSDFVLGKKVAVKLLRRDQYGRAVGKVQTSRRWNSFPPLVKKDVSIELTKKGLATLYTGGGAEYDGNRELLESLESKAKKRRRGVWSDDNYVSPAEFKRLQKLQKQQAK